MANIQEIWRNGKSLVFTLMIRNAAECSVLLLSLVLTWNHLSKKCNLAAGSYAAVSEGFSLRDSLQLLNILSSSRCVQSASKSCDATPTDIMTSSAGRRRLFLLWTCVLVCHPKLHDLPWLWRRVCNKAWLFPFWVTCLSFHLSALLPPSTHLLLFAWFPRHSLHLFTIHIWFWCCETSKKPIVRANNEKQIYSVVHMLMQANK